MADITQSHYTPRNLTHGNGSRARWAVIPSGVAVVFVHGFGGGATATWDEFGDLLPERAECAGVDLLFYGYESLTRQAPVNAALFRDFLHRLAADPFTSVQAPSLRVDRGLDSTFRYKRIVIVAHSLGAVIAREALVQAAGDHAMRDWVSRIQLALFAPAHSGAMVTELARDALGSITLPLLGFLTAGVKRYAQVLGDLEQGSLVLTRLAERTTLLLAQGVTALRAVVVVHGSNDRTVYTAVFCGDPGPRIEIDKGHRDVCKPSAVYASPIEHILPLIVI